MIADIRNNPAFAKDCYTIDLTTYKFIDYCIWSNDKSGEYYIYVTDKNNNIILEYENIKYKHILIDKWRTEENKKYGKIITKKELKKGNIKIMHLLSDKIKKTINNEYICIKKRCKKSFGRMSEMAEHYVKAHMRL